MCHSRCRRVVTLSLHTVGKLQNVVSLLFSHEKLLHTLNSFSGFCPLKGGRLHILKLQETFTRQMRLCQLKKVDKKRNKVLFVATEQFANKFVDCKTVVIFLLLARKGAILSFCQI